MLDAKNASKPKYKRISILLILLIFIIISTFILLRMNFIRDLFGIDSLPSDKYLELIKIASIIIGSLLLSVAFTYNIRWLYSFIPLKGEFIESGSLIQKKHLFPHYRVTQIMCIKGLPREDSKIDLTENTPNHKDWDTITSIAKVCDEVSFWIIKSQNRITLYFSVSSWSWFGKHKAIKKTNNDIISIKSAFSNKNPSIKIKLIDLKESMVFLDVINKCNFGLNTKGIPSRNYNITQIDRLINSLSSTKDDCFYVASFKGIRKGFEKREKSKNRFNMSVKKEFEEDFKEAKKTGQSKIGVYAFTETEEGLLTILAAMLSIWSGSHTFDVERISNGNLNRNLKILNPIQTRKLSNKAISNYIHLPNKPYLTQNTRQPVFEIPTISKNDKKYNICIGNIMQNDRILDEFNIPIDSLLFNTEIVGMIGRGKSYLVASIIDQLLNFDLGCLIFDLKGEYADFFVEEKDIIVYTIGKPAPLGINLFKINTNVEAQNVLALINEMLTIAGVPFSPTMLNIFENALQKIVERTDKNLEVFMECLNESSKEYISRMKTSYSRDSIDAILNRLNFIFGGVNFEVFNALENTINFDQLDKGKKIIIDFSEFLRRGASTASLFLVCNLVLHLLSKYASQKGITNKLRYLVILEEAMYLIPKRFNLESTASLGYTEQNFIMGRSLGIGTITIYQLWDSVSPVVHANSLTKILFRGEDIEKIRNSIALNEDQYDFLSHLPDRHFILKSKSLSGPSLLKTKTFDKRSNNKDKFNAIASRKFIENGIPYRSISRNFIDIRNDVFGENKGSESIPKKRNENGNYLDKNSWEWCINICPARIQFRNKKSDWIRDEYCKRNYADVQSITNKLFSNNIEPLIEVINTNPNYLVQKIYDYFINTNANEPNVSTFCILNLLLTKIKTRYNFSNSWKNNTLVKLKDILNSKSISNYSLQ